MNPQLRLYFESLMRVANGANPASMTDQELVGCVALLPDPAINFTEWSKKVGIEESGPRDLTEEEKAEINDRTLAQLEAVEKAKQNG